MFIVKMLFRSHAAVLLTLKSKLVLNVILVVVNLCNCVPSNGLCNGTQLIYYPVSTYIYILYIVKRKLNNIIIKYVGILEISIMIIIIKSFL